MQFEWDSEKAKKNYKNMKLLLKKLLQYFMILYLQHLMMKIIPSGKKD